MALARLALRNLQQRVTSSSSSSSSTTTLLSHGLSSDETTTTLTSTNSNSILLMKQRWGCGGVVRRYSDVPAAAEKSSSSSSSSTAEKSEGRGGEVAVSEGDNKWKLFPTTRRRNGFLRNWKDRDDHDDFVPALSEFFPSRLGNALMQATENVRRLLKNLAPSHRLKEHDQRYVLQFAVPGLAKEDMKIRVEDGLLIIRGEHKEEEEGSDDDEHGGLRNYEYYDATLVLPDDAKTDEIKAELKNGVLTLTIPRTEEMKKDVKEIPIE